MRPFVVFSLPRSRSTWLSAALSAPGRLVGHDIGIDCATINDFTSRITGPYIGTCETGAEFAAPIIKSLIPDVQFIVVLRDPVLVSRRLSDLGFGDQSDEMMRRFADLHDIAHQFKCPVFLSDAMESPAVGDTIHRYLGLPFNRAWWDHINGVNVQVDIEATKRKLVANHDRIAALKAEVAEAMANA